MKQIMAILFFGACLFALVLTVVETAGTAGGDGHEAEEAGPTLRIEASNFKFDQAEYKVTKGESLKVVLSNTEGIHGLEIVGLDVILGGGNPMSAEVTFDKAGTYEIICTVPCGIGHVDMKSILIVA